MTPLYYNVTTEHIMELVRTHYSKVGIKIDREKWCEKRYKIMAGGWQRLVKTEGVSVLSMIYPNKMSEIVEIQGWILN